MKKIIGVEEYKNKQTKKKKRKLIFNIVVIVLFAISVVYFWFLPDLKNWAEEASKAATNPALAKIISWVPPFCTSLALIVCVMFLIIVLNFIIKLFKPKSQKGKTVQTLVDSIIDYVLVIACFILVLKVWGADVSSIAISTSAIVLALGLCLKSVAEDFVCGILVVFEHHLCVGDIVTIEDFKGTIREIGTRVTLIENINNDILLVNNSDLKDIINHTSHLSKVILKVLLPKTISETQFVEVFKQNKKEIESNCPDLKSEISYYGILSFDKFNTIFALTFYVEENRSLQTQRAINSALNKIMDKQGWLK